MTSIVDRLRAYYQEHPSAARSLAPPAPRAVVEEAEATLGFTLPPLLRELYTTVGNGGFGPGAIGLAGGVADSSGLHLPELYLRYSAADPEAPEEVWPAGLVPLLEDGCGSYGCIDCTGPEALVVGFDPSAYNPDAGTPWSEAFIAEGQSLAEMIEEWLEYPEAWLEECPRPVD